MKNTKPKGQSWEATFDEKFPKAKHLLTTVWNEVPEHNVGAYVSVADDLKAFIFDLIKAEREKAVKEFAYGLKMKFYPMKNDTPMSRMIDGTNKLVRAVIDEHIDQLVKEERGK